ncbi:MAG TPA: MarR family transcriptional regulator [Thermoplasmata archaeon]|nr:MarR family transcriptional regulator [Thermoplasmata archaeon]
MSEAVREPPGFSSQRRRVLLFLKEHPDASLEEVARSLGVSKVAALRHVASLETDRLVAREYRAEGVGRPKVRFRLTAESGTLFPQAYAEMSIFALNFVERGQGRDAVVRLLQERTHELVNEHRGRMQQPELGERVRALAKIRDEGGYMAEVGRRRGATQELLEHNCPILAIAQKFPEACDVERRMFETLLRAKVDTTHRVVANDHVCRFLIRPKGADP